MSLKSIKFNRYEYTFGDTVVSLRGLSFNDFAYLMQSREEDINKAISYIKNKGADDNIGLWLLMNVPKLITEMVALSADEPDAIDIVERFPIPIQIELVENVLDATFKDAGGFANFIQLVAKKISTATMQVQAVTQGLKSRN
jgi:hypothetical protein